MADRTCNVLFPDACKRAFVSAFATLRRRVELLLALPLEKLDRLATQQELREIGQAQQP